jgi:twitching motility protein PilT
LDVDAGAGHEFIFITNFSPTMDYKAELENLLEAVIQENGSDLHLSVGRHPTMRVSGFLVPLLKKQALSKEDTLGFAKELLSPQNLETFFKTQEIDFSYSFKDKARFRGNCFFAQGGVGIALRLIPTHIRTLDELNLPPILEVFAQKQQGFFLVVGPVGHGKTTTLASLIDMINTERAEHIITIEDPIEYVFEQKKSIIDQREVRLDTHDFHTALRATFRQDVDVIMIGEMRGVETISVAVTAAETGHLVLSTLHTNDAAQTIDRIIDSFPPGQQDQIRVQLAGSLVGIFSQRLVPRISGGLIPAYELLINTAAVANLIREGRTHEIRTVIETGSEHGMIDMNRNLTELVRAGEVTVENAYTHSPNPKVLEKFI